MKLTKKKKRYVRDNYEKKSVKEMAKALKVEQKEIEKYVKKELNSKTGKIREKVNAIQLERENIGTFADLKKFIIKNKAIFLLVAALIFLVYANSLGGDFVSDDISGYVNKAPVHEFASYISKGDLRGGVAFIWENYNFHTLTHGFFYAAFGANEIPLHIYSVLIHILSAWLAFVMIAMLFDKRIAIIATLIFAVHPLNTEAIAWISGRKYLIIGGISFATIILHTMYKNTKELKYLVYEFLYFTISLMVTQYMWLVVTPLLVLIVDQLLIEKKVNIKEALKTIPITIPVALFGLLVIWGRFQTRIINLEKVYNFDRSATAPFHTRVVYSIYKSFELFIFPKNLTLYHEGEVLSKFYFAFMVAAVIGLVAIGVKYWKKDIRVTGLLLFVLVSLSPTLSPTQVAWLAAERYLYTASIALATLFAIILINIEKKTRINNLTVYVLVAVLVGLSIRTMVRNADWKTRQTVWESTQRVSPNSPRVYNNLGDVYGKQGNFEASIRMFQTAIALDPNYAEAMHNLGNTYSRMGNYEAAKQMFRRAYEYKPSQYQSIHMLGVMELQEGNLDEAQKLFESVLSVDPNYVPAQQGLELTIQAKQEAALNEAVQPN